MSQSAEGFIEDAPQDYTGELHDWPAEGIQRFDLTVSRAPEFGSCMTWNVPQAGIGQPIQILQRQPQRFKAQLVVVNAGTLMVFNSKLDPLQGATPQGYSIGTAGPIPPWECQQPLYVVCTGPGGQVSVWDQTYALR